MKYLLCIALLLQAGALLGNEACYRFRVVGEVGIKGKHMVLALAKGSASELIFTVPRSIQDQTAPYLEHTVQMEAIFSSEALDYKSQLKGIDSIKPSVPDPLNQNAATTRKLLGKTKCP